MDNTLEGTVTLNSGGIASIISTKMTSWWQSLDLSQIVSRALNVKLNDDDCEVSDTIILEYPPKEAPWD